MVSYYKTVANRLIEVDSLMPGCWISVVDPTAQERKMLIDDYGLDSDFLKSSLDEEESLGIILTDHYVFTISLRENKVINDVVSGRVRNIQTQFRTQFVLRLMMNITASFLVYLKQIDKTSSAMQRKLHGAMRCWNWKNP